MFWNAGHRFDFVRAYGILGITLDRENKFRLIKFTPFATTCKEGGILRCPTPAGAGEMPLHENGSRCAVVTKHCCF